MDISVNNNTNLKKIRFFHLQYMSWIRPSHATVPLNLVDKKVNFSSCLVFFHNFFAVLMRYLRNSTKTHKLLASTLFLASLHAVGIPADASTIVGVPTVAGILDVASATVH